MLEASRLDESLSTRQPTICNVAFQRLVDSGVPERLVQSIVRHQSIETTKRHYVTGIIQQEAKKLRMYLGTENS